MRKSRFRRSVSVCFLRLFPRDRRVLLSVFLILLMSACGPNRSGTGDDSAPVPDENEETKATAHSMESGNSGEKRTIIELPEELSVRQKVERVCGQCHQVPDPEALDRDSWERSVLPMMGWRLGIYEEEVPREEILAGAVDPERVRKENRFPADPLLAMEDWHEIRDWYLDRAPESVGRPSDLEEKLDRRKLIGNPVHELRWGDPLPAAVTLLEIDTDRSLIYVGGMRDGQGEFQVLDRNWNPLQRIPLPSAPVHLERDGSNLLLTLIGTLRLLPEGNRHGELVQLVREEGEDLFTGLQGFAGELNRPVQTLRSDLTGDGREDLVVAEFGFYSGSVTLFEQTDATPGAGSPFQRRELYSEPGAVRLQLADLDGNGEEELLVLLGQGDEGVMRFLPDGEGAFRSEWLLRFHPGRGSTDLLTGDVTGNGRVDLVVCNGDNGDFPPVLRRDHGIRIYENRGDDGFEEVYWHPMDGAYRCGWLDREERELVAISYFPDEDRSPRGDLIHVRFRGEGEAEVSEWPVDLPARWLALAAGPMAPGEDPIVLVGSHGELQSGETFDESLLRRRLSILEWRPKE
ncbi:MAG: FG-GAP repeat domain-containing protein [Bacteroidota bacterium]